MRASGHLAPPASVCLEEASAQVLIIDWVSNHTCGPERGCVMSARSGSEFGRARCLPSVPPRRCENFLHAVKGGPLRVPPRSPRSARRACGLSGPTRRAIRTAPRKRAAPRRREETSHQSGGGVHIAANHPVTNAARGIIRTTPDRLRLTWLAHSYGLEGLRMAGRSEDGRPEVNRATLSMYRARGGASNGRAGR